MQAIVTMFFLSGFIMLAPHLSEKVAVRIAIVDLILGCLAFGVDTYIKGLA
ncbi:hypothetical protein [Cupriavidus campinensis]|uniref:hypothetical protein n=1 Tax=Cupriavidus campinensis TaxID=151783 RepID=UPI00164312F1|nr:hypothetical protein [Cupriavidus campinensis]